MRISGALAKAKPLTVEFEHETLNVVYRPASYTVEELEKLVEEDGDGRKANPARIIDMMQEMIISWDLTEDNGDPIDVQDTARMRTIPTPVFMAVLRSAREDQSVGEAGRPSVAS